MEIDMGSDVPFWNWPCERKAHFYEPMRRATTAFPGRSACGMARRPSREDRLVKTIDASESYSHAVQYLHAGHR